jgi:hypothetical protein
MRGEEIHLWEVGASKPVKPGPDIRFHTIVKRNYMGEAKVLIDPEVT